MTDILTRSINLGRWSGVQIRVHYFLVILILGRLLDAVFAPGHRVAPTASWLVLLVIVLALHELGHAAMASIQNVDVEDIRLWPLGNFVVPGTSRDQVNIPVAAAGLATSGFLAIMTAVVLAMAGCSMVWSPFGTSYNGGLDSGAPFKLGTTEQITALKPLWVLGWFGHLNWVVFLANLIPALPLDNGRIVRAVLARSSVGITRDNPYAQWLAHSCAGLLTLVGLVRLVTGSYSDGLTLVVVAIVLELVVRTESQMLEDGGFFEDGVFGYDFSEGYTSLEGSAVNKVRPYRESALKRWRRRRSELRRRRRLAREAADERRMDEILAKVHDHGKAALTDEEHRFLVRVSTKLRANRPRARGE